MRILNWVIGVLGVVGVIGTDPVNVVWVYFDDLRAEIDGSYGQTGMVTPGFDLLMKEGVTFTRAYCQVPLCSPSRTASLTGLRSDFTRLWTIGPYVRETFPNNKGADLVSVQQLFKLHGYNVTGEGKIWHPGSSSGGPTKSLGGADAPYSYSYPNQTTYSGYLWGDAYYNGSVQSPKMADYAPNATGLVTSPDCIKCLQAQGAWPPPGQPWWNHTFLSVPNCPVSCFVDGAVADAALNEIQWKEAHTSPQDPFMLTVGFKRPHLAWYFPADALKPYPNSSIHLPTHNRPSVDQPPVAFYDNGEILGLEPFHSDRDKYTYPYPMSDSFNATLVHDFFAYSLRAAYKASVTHSDSQLLRVIQGIKTHLADRKVLLVVMGDHGYSIQENGEWAKQNLHESATRIPLVFWSQNMGLPQGVVVDEIVEAIDVYPTLADFANIPLPSLPSPSGSVGGRSIASLIRNPSSSKPNETFALSQIERIGSLDDEGVLAVLDPEVDGYETEDVAAVERGLPLAGFLGMGVSIRTNDWRYTEWINYNLTTGTPLWNQVVGLELYDHRGDTDKVYGEYEGTNLANNATFAAVQSALQKALRSNWNVDAPKRTIPQIPSAPPS